MTYLTSDWLTRFPALSALTSASRHQLLGSSQVLRVPEGRRIFEPGDNPTHYLLALEGSVRVQKTSGSGREIVLYRVSPGESCVLTTACLIGAEAYEAEAIAECAVEAVGIPRKTFEDLVGHDGAFRRFVFSGFSTRMIDLLRLIDEVAFERIDTRLANKLIELAGPDGQLSMTQAQLAAELGSAREVISRQLQEFQRHGWLVLARGTISITDRSALARYCRNS